MALRAIVDVMFLLLFALIKRLKLHTKWLLTYYRFATKRPGKIEIHRIG